MAILPQGGEVTLAHIVRSRGALPRLERLESFAVEGGLADALGRLRSAERLASYACTTLLPGGEYALTPLDAPAVPREERREALRWALKDMVGHAVDTACIDVLDIPADSLSPGRTPGVLVVSAPEQAVRQHVAPFEAARLVLAAVDIPELAQRNVAALLEDENRGLVLLRIDGDGVMLTLTWRGELVAVRRRDEREIHILNSGDTVSAEALAERLALELQRSLDNFDRQYSHIAISRIVVALPQASEVLLTALAAGSYLPVEVMDLSGLLDFSRVPELREPGLQARHLLAIGAALRDEVPA